ncbi:MAG: mechanosensitive ion channel [Solobacterium sp.]|jgi:small conductance mechanosensitive channel|nr:mechanosensitive ion channel [Solobacterium sp.]MBR2844614.1 mechanosensitive ion channel [Solobacterium sp.]MBR3343336.1 mechanosensitive ion channel [Solobacterium sp.]HAE16990.1 mechanosensitive ion channel protein [Erysipelotrichaceae bacterium]
MPITEEVNQFTAFLKQIEPMALEFLIHLVISIVIFLVGKKLIKIIQGLAQKMMERVKMDVSIMQFLLSLLTAGLWVILAFMIAGELGFNTASIIALLGSAALAIGLSLQGSLANLAGGVLILLLRPFKVGDFISTSFGDGLVQRIGLIYTELRTGDFRLISIPNGALSNSAVTNMTAYEKRRVDVRINIPFDQDIKKARDVVEQAIQSVPMILKDEGCWSFVASLGENGVTLGAAGWVKSSDYIRACGAVTEAVKLAFDEAGIRIPYKQVEIRMQDHD